MQKTKTDIDEKQRTKETNKKQENTHNIIVISMRVSSYIYV